MYVKIVILVSMVTVLVSHQKMSLINFIVLLVYDVSVFIIIIVMGVCEDPDKFY